MAGYRHNILINNSHFETKIKIENYEWFDLYFRFMRNGERVLTIKVLMRETIFHFCPSETFFDEIVVVTRDGATKPKFKVKIRRAL